MFLWSTVIYTCFSLCWLWIGACLRWGNAVWWVLGCFLRYYYVSDVCFERREMFVDSWFVKLGITGNSGRGKNVTSRMIMDWLIVLCLCAYVLSIYTCLLMGWFYSYSCTCWYGGSICFVFLFPLWLSVFFKPQLLLRTIVACVDHKFAISYTK